MKALGLDSIKYLSTVKLYFEIATNTKLYLSPKILPLEVT